MCFKSFSFFILLCMIFSVFFRISFAQDSIKQDSIKQDSNLVSEVNGRKLEIKSADQIQDIESRIHELQKEKYMLEMQLLHKRRIDRSGYFLGFGTMMGFAKNIFKNALKSDVDYKNMAVLKAGYIYYPNDFIGTKVELFSLFNWYGFNDNAYGMRLSVLNDMHFSNFYFGIFYGCGFGRFSGVLDVNLHFGISLTITKHNRLEVEHIFMSQKALKMFNNYVVSYSFIF